MARLQSIRTIIFERIKNSPKARKALAKKAAEMGRTIDPNNWTALLAFLKEFLPQLFEFILKLI